MGKNYKKLTDSVVMDTAIELIKSNGQTTTLDVKKELRNNGYFAEQVEVSTIMDLNHRQHNLDFSNNGSHRIYTMLTVNKGASGIVSSTGTIGNTGAGGLSIGILGKGNRVSQSATISSVVYTKKSKGKFSYKNINPIDKKDAVKGDWKVIDCYDNHTPLYFQGNIPKYTVRYKYFKVTGINYVDVRARRIKD